MAMPLSQMFDKMFGMIKSDMYVIKLQEKERIISFGHGKQTDQGIGALGVRYSKARIKVL